MHAWCLPLHLKANVAPLNSAFLRHHCAVPTRHLPKVMASGAHYNDSQSRLGGCLLWGNAGSCSSSLAVGGSTRGLAAAKAALMDPLLDSDGFSNKPKTLLLHSSSLCRKLIFQIVLVFKEDQNLQFQL